MARLTGDEIERGSAPTPWERDGDAIARDLRFVHGRNRVRLTLSTRSQGGITQAGLDLARAIDATVARVA
jgi:hypothetical protein